MFVFKLGSGEIFAGVTGGLGRTHVHSCRTVSRIYSGTGSGRQGADCKSPTGVQGIVGGSACEESATGGQKSRSGVGNWRADRPTGTRRRAGGQAGEGSITGSQAGGSGDGDRGADRPTGTGRQAGGQTGEGSLTGRVE